MPEHYTTAMTAKAPHSPTEQEIVEHQQVVEHQTLLANTPEIHTTPIAERMAIASGVTRQLNRQAAKIVGLQCAAEQLVQLTDAPLTDANAVAVSEIAESLLYSIEDLRADLQSIAEQLHNIAN